MIIFLAIFLVRRVSGVVRHRLDWVTPNHQIRRSPIGCLYVLIYLRQYRASYTALSLSTSELSNNGTQRVEERPNNLRRVDTCHLSPCFTSPSCFKTALTRVTMAIITIPREHLTNIIAPDRFATPPPPSDDIISSFLSPTSGKAIRVVNGVFQVTLHGGSSTKGAVKYVFN